jgi:hypothetical protein
MHSEFMPTGATITSERYVGTLQILKAHTRRVRPDMQPFFLQHDNTKPHRNAQTTAEIHRFGFNVLCHPSYNPDLVPSDFYHFPKLKEHLRGHHLLSDDGVKTAVKMWFRQQDAQFCHGRQVKLRDRCRKCMHLS